MCIYIYVYLYVYIMYVYAMCATYEICTHIKYERGYINFNNISF